MFEAYKISDELGKQKMIVRIENKSKYIFLRRFVA